MGGAYCARAIRKAWRKVRAKWWVFDQHYENKRIFSFLATRWATMALGGSCRAATFLPGEPGRSNLLDDMACDLRRDL
ncbi:hypothetical protein ACIQTU_05465 [Brevundimonas sp. NPDC090276]|uniref:hypothetical protein n=1 Tax=Brevundimonas sp. NPDC090276 TaxID=3363956 RepID=UPI00383B30AA